MDGYVLVGGFSYEDRSRAGIIAALAPLMQEIKRQSEQNKPVLGICNGAQILVESGLVPGLDTNDTLALTDNKRIVDGKIMGTGFYNAWINLRLATNYQNNAFTSHLSTSDVLHLPTAHGEGRFVMPDALLEKLEKQGLILFQYCNEQGELIDNFPINPNGSMKNIAAICNQAGNVMAIMPHPERTIHGDPIFTSIRAYIETKKEQTPINRNLLTKTSAELQSFNKIPGSYQCLVKLIITDNQALTVQQTLRQLGFPVIVQRFVHWEIDCDSQDMIEQIKKSAVLYCPRKEQLTTLGELEKKHSPTYLVRAKDDLIGQQALQTLTSHYSVEGVKKLATVWYGSLRVIQPISMS
ncbi:phosphoribosylformylglycinamidine synthase I [Legionella tunisiensis]|uniref:phosphoribosylformylglycinamidine synthase I n=1 Tax=Legionella tunisiensis TaxID=1034944 RepID=UPI00037D8F2B|nr:phosphoribosylformylglycinamidine synthase I [Legionella tunisiensis]